MGGVGAAAFLGLGTFAMGALRLPAWARTRQRQMDGVAARLALTASGEGSGGS